MEFRLVSDNEVVEITATLIIDMITMQVKQGNEKILIGLSGGNSPVALYKALADSIPAELARCLTCIQIDERVVDIHHQDSNQNLIRTHLKPMFAKGANFIAVSMEKASPLSIANEYEVDIEQVFAETDFSLSILGVGNDGHTASIFPNEQVCALSKQYVFSSTTEHVGYARISLSFQSLFAFDYSIVYAPGESKLEIVSLIQDVKNKEKYPAARIVHSDNNGVVIASRE